MKLKAKKSLGQNFLTVPEIPLLMVKSLNIKTNDNIIEIGGGLGALTNIIANTDVTFNLDVYELDKRFIKILKDIKYKENINLNIYNEDFLRSNLFKRYENKNIKVIGSIPYYITSPIIHSLLKMNNKPTIITLLVQKEVAEKITSNTPKANYWSSLTSIYERKVLKIVPKEAFNPIPKVDSAVIHLKLGNETIPIPIQEWSRFLHLAYKNPRKMLNKTFKPDILKQAHIDPSLRPQNITTVEWKKLYDIINCVK